MIERADLMKVDEALDYLKRCQVTSSRQMLLRWIRQGKIQAKMNSKYEGYEINQASLELFATQKKYSERDQSQKSTANYKAGYEDGFKAALKEQGEEQRSRRESDVAFAIRNREKELIEAGAYTERIVILRTDKLPTASLRYMNSVEARQFAFRILGSWALVEETRDLIDIDYLDYPNRKLHTRLRDWIKTQKPVD